MYCMSCGQPLPNHAQFCFACGAATSGDQSSLHPQEGNTTSPKEQVEYTAIEAEELGMATGLSVVSSLLGSPSIDRCRFVARATGPGGSYEVADTGFLRMYMAPIEQLTAKDRTDAQKALAVLHDALINDGWRELPNSPYPHWYSRRYARHYDPAAMRFSGPILAVSKTRRSHYNSIGAALRAAPKGDLRIVLKPGVYRESLSIKNPLQLIGDGDPGDVVLEVDNNTCVWAKANRAHLQGITVRFVGRNEEKKFSAVCVTAGHLLLEDCFVTTSRLSCIEVRGTGTRATIRRCEVVNSPQSGIYVHDGASARIQETSVYGNNRSGIHCERASSVDVDGSRIDRNKGHGVSARDCVELHVMGTRMTENGQAGVAAFATPCMVEGTEIARSGLDGVHAEGDGNQSDDCNSKIKTVVKDCRITQSGGYGTWVSNGGYLILVGTEPVGSAKGYREIKDTSCMTF